MITLDETDVTSLNHHSPLVQICKKKNLLQRYPRAVTTATPMAKGGGRNGEEFFFFFEKNYIF
jgi:hypothetical protein